MRAVLVIAGLVCILALTPAMSDGGRSAAGAVPFLLGVVLLVCAAFAGGNQSAEPRVDWDAVADDDETTDDQNGA